MPASHLTRSQSQYFGSAVILSLGCAAALLIFLTGSPEADADIAGYRLVGGRIFPITIEDSARSVQTLEARGGRAEIYARDRRVHGWFEAASTSWPPRDPFSTLAHRLTHIERICWSRRTSASLLIGAAPT